MDSKKKIAVVGSGVAGLTAAYLLDPIHDVTLYEKADRLGGHTNTIFLPDGPDQGTPVDTGFIVFNQKNYPLLCRLFDRLNVETAASDMAFGLTHQKTGLEYCSDFPKGLFAQKRNLLSPTFISLIRDILRVNKLAKADIDSNVLNGKTLGEWLDFRRASVAYRDLYLLPMGAAIWSMPASEMMSFPAAMFLRFFENHGLWDLKDRPKWRFVVGGSQSYIQKIKSDFRGKILTGSGVLHIKRVSEGVEVKTKNGIEKFDAVVIAAHADEAFSMLDDPSLDEKKYLSPWQYTPNEAVLHWDDALMPKRRAAWASWNMRVTGSANIAQPVVLTYWMNRLQNLKTNRNYFVTLNATQHIDSQKVIRRINYTHPHFSFKASETQKNLRVLNGVRSTYFCGSYFGYGFHEDAVRSAVQVSEMLGSKL